jgi:predicted RND superfamily exporter protein
VLVVTFKSAVLPFLLLFTIEVGIWINLSIPYFSGNTMNFLGYLVISSVQLGATVDYAILFTSYYLDNRREMALKEAIHRSMGETFKSILISGMVLAVSGLALSVTSTNPVVSGLGMLLARGTLLSMTMVLCLLPILLRIFDKPIGVATYRANFYRENPPLKKAHKKEKNNRV